MTPTMTRWYTTHRGVADMVASISRLEEEGYSVKSVTPHIHSGDSIAFVVVFEYERLLPPRPATGVDGKPVEA